MFVTTVDDQALLDFHVDLTCLCNKQGVTACVLKPSKSQVVKDFDVSFLLQVLRVILGEDVSLVDELDELGGKLCIVVLFDIVNAAIVALVEEAVVVAHFTIPAHPFAQTIAFWAA